MLQSGGNSAVPVVKGAIATVALVFAYISIPVVGIVAGIVTPLPALFYSLKSGRRSGLTIVALSTAAIFAYSPGGSMVYLIQGGVISLVLAEALRRGEKRSRAITLAACAAGLVAAIAIVSLSAAAGTGFHRLVVAGIDDIIGQSIELYRGGGIEAENLRTLEEGLRQTGAMLSMVYPSLLLLYLGFVSAANVQLMRKAGQHLPGLGIPGRFSEFRNPEPMVWVLIAAGFLALVPHEVAKFAALNLLTVCIVLYFVQGLAIAACLFERYRVARPWRLLMYFLIAVQPYLAVGVTAFGLFDLWIDFRRPRNRQNL